ncbi:putative DCC family thiol-disulfide oxidoreductase YuxK [Arcicella aurantiaca]|uniref:Putative DCC family thiol-disulfide oxidoreductase YuxK n=1 Tax=Arcicella aurantiaca TaxID=591202 RepID=A0A316E8Z8_9BACT|nr:thiol-disulfide oxidoreductase DCC family protein [Arcicella aurantiaca]PWK26138.1 putative DCC family thiol-disulfide oxidoreductase YuxK [Arcicella aurantiaca]
MPKSKEYQIILFDGVCNFCNSSINFIIDHDPEKNFKFASLQSDFGQKTLRKFNKNTEDFDSVILIKNNQLYQKAEAALEITKQLSGLWKYLSIFKILPTSILNFFYNIIAQNRYRIFGKSDTCRMPTPDLKERFLVENS